MYGEQKVRCIGVSLIISTLILGIVGAQPIYAQPFYVSNNNDSGADSLRQAISDMNSLGVSPASIVFQISGSKVIQLQSALPSIEVSVTINPTAVSGIVLDGTNAGFVSGLVFQTSTGQYSNVIGLQIQDFSLFGIVINPDSNYEIVNVINCYVTNCGANGIQLANGQNHTITSNSVIANNDGWGVSFSNDSISNVQIQSTSIQSNNLGGIQFLGDGHLTSNCFIVLNGSAESGDHRGGVVFGATGTTATNCRAVNCTVAANAPWGAKRVYGNGNEMQGNETYDNTQMGYKVLISQPQPALNRFVVDDVNDEIVIRGSISGASNNSIEVEFFVPIDITDQGAAYLDTADLLVQLDASGNANFFHKFDRDGVFNGTAILPNPLPFTIDETDPIVVTATSSSSGTSEFSNRATATLPGDFDLDGDVDGGDFMTWMRNYGSQDAEYWEGDADFDGDVDQDDKDIWSANFGSTP